MHANHAFVLSNWTLISYKWLIKISYWAEWIDSAAEISTTLQTFLPHQQIPSGSVQATLVLILVSLMLHLISHLCYCSYNNVKAPNSQNSQRHFMFSAAASIRGFIKVVPPRTTLFTSLLESCTVSWTISGINCWELIYIFGVWLEWLIYIFVNIIADLIGYSSKLLQFGCPSAVMRQLWAPKVGDRSSVLIEELLLFK